MKKTTHSTEQDALKTALDRLDKHAPTFLSATFSRACAKYPPLDELVPPAIALTKTRLERVKIKPTTLNGKIGFFTEFFTKEKAFHHTYTQTEFPRLIRMLCPAFFQSLVLRFHSEDSVVNLTLLANKKGKLHLLQTKEAENPRTENAAANRTKRYLIPEGIPVPFLVHLGVMTPEGNIVASKRKKFRQINRFLEFIDDIIRTSVSLTQTDSDAANNLTENRAFHIVDFGSGKSYLTFAVHHLFTVIHKRPVVITGIDEKEEVVAHCNELVRLFSSEGLSFHAGRIEDFTAQDTPAPDLLITLHACDTATDYALAYAIQRGVHAIISVPCCQHELNAHLTAQNVPPSLHPLVSHGLLKERFSALATDAIRIACLEQAGYTVQALEFVDTEDTPKNLLIRAVKKAQKQTTVRAETVIKDPLSQALDVSLTLERLLTDR